jgi:hypothetical protein
MPSAEQVQDDITRLANRVDWPPLPKVELQQSTFAIIWAFLFERGGKWGQFKKGTIWPSVFGVPLLESDIPMSAYPLVEYLEKLSTSMLQRQYNNFFLRLGAPMRFTYRWGRGSDPDIGCRVSMDRDDALYPVFRGIHGLLVRELQHRKVPNKNFGRTRL